MTEEAAGSRKAEKKDPAAMEETSESEMTAEQRHEVALELVDRFSLWGGAAGLIPAPLLDVAVVSGVQLQMLRRLSQIYSVPFSENVGKSVLASLLGSVIPTTSGTGITSVLKGVPLIGAILVFVTPSLSAGATYVIGRTFIEHFAAGGTLLDFNPLHYREFIKAQKEKWSGRSAATPPVAQSSSSARSTAS